MTEQIDKELAVVATAIADSVGRSDYRYDKLLQIAARLRQRSEDAELLDWAESNPAEGMSALSSLWAQLGRGARETYMNWRFALRNAAARKAK